MYPVATLSCFRNTGLLAVFAALALAYAVAVGLLARLSDPSANG
jgi:hypothetical protein